MSWVEDFFQGMALDLWRGVMTDEMNEEEASFVEGVLQLPEGAKVLDVPCGTGRLARLLAARGYDVTGVDISAESLKQAKTDETDETKVSYVQADMSNLQWRNEFEGAFCMGNSFGYANREGTQQFISAVAAALKPGASFLLDTNMAAETFLLVGGQKEWTQVGDIFMLMDNQYDCRESRLDSTFTFFRNGQREDKKSSHWIFTSGEICEMMRRVGFKIDELWSSIDCEPFAVGASRLLILATKME